MQDKFNDEDLMAYADGELDADTRSQIERAVARDAGLGARLAVFTKTRASASAAFEPLLDAPVPDALARHIAEMVEQDDSEAPSAPDRRNDTTGTVIAFDRKRWFAGPRLELGLAASIALIIGGIAGFAISDGIVGPSSDGIVVASVSDPTIPAALRTVVSGDEVDLEGGQRFRAIASFRDDADHFCREFELDGVDQSTFVSVACIVNAEWQLQFTVMSASSGRDYAPASSLEALDAYLQAINASEPLSLDAERKALTELP